MGSGGKTPDAQPIPETEQEKALAETMKGQWAHYTTDLRPLEDRWLATLKTDAGDKAMVAGQTAAGIGNQFDKAQEGMTGGMFAKNIDPSSGKFVGAMNGLTMDKTKTVGAGTTKASQAVDDATVENLQNAVSVGRGQAVEATQGMGSLASKAQGDAIANTNLTLRSDMADQERSEALAGTAMSAAGLGLKKFNPVKLSGGTKTAGSW